MSKEDSKHPIRNPQPKPRPVEKPVSPFKKRDVLEHREGSREIPLKDVPVKKKK